MDSQDIPSIVESDDIPSISEEPSTPVVETPKQEAVAVVTDASQEHNSIEFETTQEIDETIQNVTLYSDARVKKPENFNSVERPIDEILGLPQYSTAKLQDILKRLPNIDFGDAKDIQRWKLRLNESLEAGTFDDLFKDALERKDSDWVNSLSHNGFNISPGYPKIEVKERSISGERGLIHLASHIGQGSVYQQALYHSGFWITFKPPGDDQIIELNRIIGSDKIEFGRDTYGAVFANTTVYTMRRLVNFAMSNLYNHSVNIEKADKVNLIDLVSIHDYYPLLQGLAATMYPRGLVYESACVKDPAKCTHVTKELLNLAKLLVVDKSALTDWQKQHMTTRGAGKMSVASIKQYQKELTKLGDRKISITTNIGTTVTFTLGIPNIPSTMKIGTEWVDGIVDHVEKLAGSGASADDKEEMFARYSMSSYLNKYAHIIKAISFGVFEECTDVEDIKRYLPQLSSDESIRTNLEKEIKKYLNDTTIAVVGIPLYDCENCGAPQTTDVVYPRHQNIIPLDVPNVFFQLASRRLKTILRR